MGPLAPPRTRWIYDCYDWRAKDHLDLPPGDSQAKEWEHSAYKYIYIYTFICVYSKKIEGKYTIYNNMCVYIYIRAMPGLCPGVAAFRVPIPNQMLLQLCIPLGRSTKVLGNIKTPPPLNSTFHWEDRQRY